MSLSVSLVMRLDGAQGWRDRTLQCHIVPRFMLAGFADPETDHAKKKRLWKYRFDIGKWSAASPRSVASALDYYLVKDAGGNRDDRIERQVIGPIEDAMAKLLKSRLRPAKN